MPFSKRFFLRRTGGVASAVAAGLLTAASASAEPAGALPGPIAPTDGRGVGYQLFVDSVVDEDFATPIAGGAVPLFQDEDQLVALFGEGYFGFELDAPDDFFGGAVGAAYRARLSEASAFGLNAFGDLGQIDSEFVAAVGGGLEFEQILDPASVTTALLGANGYYAIDDYGDIADFGDLERAPQTGADVYLKLGRNFSDVLRGEMTIGGFGYAGGDDSDQLLGVNGAVGGSYAGFGENIALTGYVGPRYANGGDGVGNSDGRLDVFGGLGLTVAFGGGKTVQNRIVEQQALNAPRDCVVARDPDGARFFDCQRPVQLGEGGAAKDGGFVRERLAAPAPEIRVEETFKPGVAPVRPERHIGFGTAFSPIRR